MVNQEIKDTRNLLRMAEEQMETGSPPKLDEGVA